VIFIQPEIVNKARSRRCGFFDCCNGFLQASLRRRQKATLVDSKRLQHPANFAKSVFDGQECLGAVIFSSANRRLAF